VNGLLPLPIDEALPQLLAALEGSANAVLRAPAGAGKTTRVPPALLEHGRVQGRLVMLEPRRIAARAAARRIAEERGWEVGREVGYQVRFERRATRDTHLLVVTEGILVQMLQADPFLDGVGALVFDEVHERSLFTDLALAMARRVQREARPELRLLAMSATLEAVPLAAFLGDCPVVESAGRLFPVEVAYLERPDERPLAAQIAAGVRRALAAIEGDVLVFLPGVGEIRAAEEALAPFAAERGFSVTPLYGDLPAEQQDAALRPLGRRKVVLATNVAESSVTVDGVRAVVDSGLARTLRYDAGSGLDRLVLGRISRASSDQRCGRAGRQAPGWCLRLWTAHEQRGLVPFERPEIARVDLAWPALQLLAWGERDLTGFGWLEPPDPAALARALDLLAGLGALEGGHVTALGQSLARFPLHPRLARLLVGGARRGVLHESALAAALLSERDPFRAPRQHGRPSELGSRRTSSRSDVLDRVEALAAFSRRHPAGDELPLQPGAARQTLRAAEQLESMAGRLLDGPTADSAEAPHVDPADALLAALAEAYPDRIARRREPGSPRAVMVGGKGLRLAPSSAVVEEELFAAVDLDAGREGPQSEAWVRLASGVKREWLAAGTTTLDELTFDGERERVVAFRRTRFADLVLDEREVPVRDATAAAELLSTAAATDLSRALPLDQPETAGLLTRLQCLREWRPELDLPACDAAALRELLPALCAGRRSFAELRQVPLAEVLLGTLSHRQREALAREAPERLVVPSGSAIRLRYEPGRPPVLAARIQELFGLAETPRVAGGRVPVLLHLLAPNQRPQQVTDDLASFWRTTYREVRRELAGRYPKHAWPEDPLAAAPQRGPRRRTG
jgi:ATP-dependent helicase HrpB